MYEIVVHKDVITVGPNTVCTGDARCWVETPGGVLFFRSGYFLDYVRASFGEPTPSTQPAAVAIVPPVETPAPAETPTEPAMPPQEPPMPPAEPVAPAPEAVQPTSVGDTVPAEVETPPSPY